MNIKATLLWSGTCKTLNEKMYYTKDATKFPLLAVVTEFYAGGHYQTDIIRNDSSLENQNISKNYASNNYTYFHVRAYPTYLQLKYIDHIAEGIKQVWGVY